MDGEEREQREPGLMLFEQAVEQARVAICFSDMRAPDNPLTYVNPAFEAMTGYARAEAVGRNCRFLQGAGTDPAAVDRLRRAVAAGEPATVEILNYRRDGSPFWNALHIAPVLGPDGEVVQYYGSQLDVSAEVAERLEEAKTSLLARELRHRTANLFSVFGALVGLSLPKEASPDAVALADAIGARVQALGQAHRLVTRPGEAGEAGTDLATLLDAIVAPFAASGRLVADGPAVALGDRVAGPLALVLHELVTNAVKHGALREGSTGTGMGTVAVTWTVRGGDVTLRWSEEGPAPADASRTEARADADTPVGTGTQIIDGVLASLGGRIERTRREAGLTAVLTLPL